MASLAVSYADITAAVAQFVGWAGTADAAKLAAIDAAVQDGYRQFLYPVGGHDWTFLHPITTLTTYAPYSTGTVAATSGSAIVTLTDGVFPSWAAGCSIQIDGVNYTVSTRDSNTQVTLTANYAGTTATGLAYVLTHTGIYSLPADFAAFDARPTFPAEQRYAALQVVGESWIRQRQQHFNSSGVPQYIAVRPIKMTAAGAQTFQAILYPTPSDAWVLTYSYRVQPQKLDATTYTYPYGADRHGLCIKESCLAAAEAGILHTSTGEHRQMFLQQMAAAISEDRRNVPGNLGYCGDASDDRYVPDRTISVHYNGQEI